MILIFDFFETLVHSRSMDFNRGLQVMWEKYYKERCSFEKIKEYGEELFHHIMDMHAQGKEYAFVKEELPQYAAKFGGETILMTVDEEADFLMLCNEIETMPGIPEALAEFEKMKIPMYILSNSGFTAGALGATLERLGIGRYFTKIWSSADFGRIKPDRDFFEMAIGQALYDHPGEERNDMVFVGDTYGTDVIGAYGAAIEVIWLKPKGEADPNQLKIHIIGDIGGLVSTVKDMRGPQHRSLLETTMNTRDLGGYESDIPGVMTKCNRIYRSDKQNYPSERDIAFLKEKRMTTIIDMRGAEDIAKSPSGFAEREGFTYLNFPIDEGSSVPESVGAVPGSYLDIAQSKNISGIFKAIAAAGEGVMINCSAGKDRTGVVSALLLSLCGVSREDIISDYMITKECNKERFWLVRQNLPGIDINIVIPRESYMGDFLDLLYDQYGDIENYFEAIGVDAVVRAAIRRKLMAG